MSMQFFSIGQLAAGIAFLLLAYAFFLLSDRLPSLNAKYAAIAFAYCGLSSLVQLFAILAQYTSGESHLASLAHSMLFQMAVGGLRPFALLLAAFFSLRVAQSDVKTSSAS